ncbi:Gfo/Idh/MocA family protein [Actinoalloteichus hymeniacidonis]|uniref:Dehydrogenase n=1 Tax=Actinoalloteichus hymeniacidonis TaxID=340345 RepID=A0AAC9HKH7_9PSEU|nr:Gfo/Idh/MocA family oxidoreductase [Actinoalloteichus hymeniacidonis]AOS61092.1 putative dehydrogenase [Actinoalloteichus hymeniacidonis]MBB5910908.1 putative dehydrogenase [Actinoalloteichus hymeniacidonis]
MDEREHSEQLRVGLIGAGQWAKVIHAPGIAAHPGTRLTSVWARRPEAAAEIAQQHGAEVAADPEALFDSVDAVAFAVPPNIQADLARTAAQRGKHLILEKPIALSVEAAEQLAETVSDNKVASLMLLTRRFAPEVRDWLAEVNQTEGWQGGSVRWLSGSLLDAKFADSRWRHTETGDLFDVGPHAIDLLDAALGPVTGVHAVHRTEEAVWQLILEHEGGATSTATLSMRTPIRPSINDLSVFGKAGHREFRGASTEPPACYTALLDDFVAMIGEGRHQHPLDVRRGVHLQRILESARDLAAAGR